MIHQLTTILHENFEWFHFHWILFPDTVGIMTSSPSSCELIELVHKENTERLSSNEFKFLFDHYAELFSPNTSAEIIHSLSKIQSLRSDDGLSHLNHRIISLIYDRLIELIEKFVLNSGTLSNDEFILMENCLEFISNVLNSVYDENLDIESNEHHSDDANNEDGNLRLVIRETLYREIIPLKDSFLKFIKFHSWNIMESYQHIWEKIVKVLIQRDAMMVAQLNFMKKDELSSLQYNEDNQLLFDVFVQYLTSIHGASAYIEAVKRLNSISTSEHDKTLLFDSFNFIINNALYTKESRTKFCSNFWLPKYENLLKELLAIIEIKGKDNDIQLRLNAIKYLIMNLMNMQLTEESIFMPIERPVQNFALKDEYLPIIKMLLPWFSNPYILESLSKNDSNTDYGIIPFQWDNNYYENTIQTLTITFVTWTIVQLILMFINTNGDCLVEVKYTTEIKEILLQFMDQINNVNPIKLCVYNILALLLDEKDIKNGISFTKEIITTLINSIRVVNKESTIGEIPALFRLYDLITLLTTLKGKFEETLESSVLVIESIFEFTQLKTDCLLHNGLELLMEVAMEKSRCDKMLLKSILSIDDESTMNVFDNLAIPKGVQIIYTKTKKATETVEQLALECFFTMSFNMEAAQLLKNNQAFMNHIRQLAEDKNKTTNPGLKKAADGVLWKLEKENEFKKQCEEMTGSQTTQFDFMISYSWSDKPLVRKIYKYLTEQCNYRVWLDENELSGSLCQAMAQGIEKSKIILLCMSETYKQSESCRNEAEYARARKKTIIPLKMREVQLDDWLGFLVAGKLYINFGKHDFETSMGLLINEIERRRSMEQTTKQTTTLKRYCNYLTIVS
ncbi:unnamed protein product [Rotaria sp. Silwood1]|nr:unnamed protein product [Rotaria sp. Silwood1]